MPCRHSDEDKVLLRYKFRSPSGKGRKTTPFTHDGLLIQSIKGGNINTLHLLTPLSKA